MMLRPWMIATISLGTLVAWRSFTPAAVRHYRVDLKTSVTQDLTALGQGQQSQNFTNAGFVSLTAQDSADGQAVTLILDSLVPGDSSPITPEVAKGMAGLKWRGFRQPTGRVKGLALEGDSPAAGAIEPALLELFPPMKPATKEGQSWTDTVDTENGGVAVRTVTNFQTSSDTYNGTRVIKLAGAYSSATSGEQAGPQGTLKIDGTGTGTNTWLVGPDGVCLSATHAATQNLSLSIAQVPEPIPVTLRTEGTAILLK